MNASLSTVLHPVGWMLAVPHSSSRYSTPCVCLNRAGNVVETEIPGGSLVRVLQLRRRHCLPTRRRQSPREMSCAPMNLGSSPNRHAGAGKRWTTPRLPAGRASGKQMPKWIKDGFPTLNGGTGPGGNLLVPAALGDQRVTTGQCEILPRRACCALGVATGALADNALAAVTCPWRLRVGNMLIP